MNKTQSIRAADAIIKQFAAYGVDKIYGVPGESYLSVLDALVDFPHMSYLTCRQEGGAAIMAEAYGKLTGKPGICMVTRAPGLTNASAGLHIAHQDSTPMIMLIGQISRKDRYREVFQEVDYEKLLAPLTKWVVDVQDPQRLPEIIMRAFHVALSGRPGPVAIALPEDILEQLIDAPMDIPALHVPRMGVDSQAIDDVIDVLDNAKQALIIVGGGVWNQQASDDLQQVAQDRQIAVASSFRRQDYIDNNHPCYIGHMGLGADSNLLEYAKNADVIVALGTRLSDTALQGHELFDLPYMTQKLIHVFPSTQEINRIYQADLAIVASPIEFIAALKKRPHNASRDSSVSDAHQAYLQHSSAMVAVPDSSYVNLTSMMMALSDALPKNSIICNGAGNYAAWLHRYFRYKQTKTQLAPTSGSMGYGLPAAVAAASVYNDRAVVCFAGDGCLMMTVQELATAIRYQLKLIVIVINNNQLGTIRMHQERDFPGRTSGTMLTNPDFIAVAKGFGLHAQKIDALEDVLPAIDACLAFNGPSLIEIPADPNLISPVKRLD